MEPGLKATNEMAIVDDTQAWSLDPDGGWHRIPKVQGMSVQDALRAAALERSVPFDDPLRPVPTR